MSESWCQEYDAEVFQFLEGLMDSGLDSSQQLQVVLPFRLGGCSVGSAVLRRSAAFLGSWLLCAADATSVAGISSVNGFETTAPAIWASLMEAQERLAQQGVPQQKYAWERAIASPQEKMQRNIASSVVRSAYTALLTELSEEDVIDFRSAGGVMAGSWLLPPSSDEHVMPNEHFKICLQDRLRVRSVPEGQVKYCKHRAVESGTLCGTCLDARGHHARTCKAGGDVVRGHNKVRDLLAKWIESVTGRRVWTKQYEPRWDQHDTHGKLVRARLDVIFFDRQGRKTFIDVEICDASTVNAAERRARASKDGVAARKGEAGKHRRYPGPDLMPFVVEALGRPGASAVALMKTIAAGDAEALREGRQTLSVAVQMRNAELLLSALRA
jgi:hypothetical protein